jgi:hypothetical protein
LPRDKFVVFALHPCASRFTLRSIHLSLVFRLTPYASRLT